MVGVTEAWAIACVFVGCQACNVALEYIVADPFGKSFGVGLTFLQFAGVAFFSLGLNVTRAPVDRQPHWSVAGLRMKDRHLSWRGVCWMAVLHWGISTLINACFGCGVGMPLHMVFRSSSLVVNMAVGAAFFGRRHTQRQVLCAAAVCGGVSLLSITDAAEKMQAVDADGFEQRSDLLWWLLGVASLAATAAAGAGLGLLQDHVYSLARAAAAAERPRGPGPTPAAAASAASAGRGRGLWCEALLYTHLLPLPLFAAVRPLALAGQLRALPPRLLPAVAVNCAAQFTCVAGVYLLMSCTSSFTVTFVVTMRKMATLLLSLLLFPHSLTPLHYVAICTAMAGAAVYPFLPKAP